MHDIAGAHDHGDLGGRLRRLVGGCATAVMLLSVIVYIAVWLGMRTAQEEARASLAWPTAPGKIIESEAVPPTGGRAAADPAAKPPAGAYRASVRYSYEAAGAPREGTRIEVFTRLDATRDAALARLAPFPVGAEVAVRFDPEEPSRSVLVPGPAEFDNTAFLVFGGGLVAVAIVLALVLRSTGGRR
jgi:hypothetical protein